MSESQMRTIVFGVLRDAGMDPCSVENCIGVGTPDVNCTAGWIELKSIRKWPKRPTTVLQVRHFTQEQGSWLERRWKADRGAWLLIRVARDWMLFNGEIARIAVGKVPRTDMIYWASAWWRSREEMARGLPAALRV